jgi:hypothetical protein
MLQTWLPCVVPIVEEGRIPDLKKMAIIFSTSPLASASFPLKVHEAKSGVLPAT